MSPAGGRAATIEVGPVHVAPGSGVLVRRDGGLLYVEQVERAAGLIESFVQAGVSDLLDAVTDEATRVGFAVSPFVVLSWVGPLHVVVFGDLDVVTDHPSMPMLSGSGSSSWVERRVRLEGGTEPTTDSTVSIQVGAAADPMSDLQLGRAVAGGFAATFRSVASDARTIDALAAVSPSPAPPAPSSPEALAATTSPTTGPTSPPAAPPGAARPVDASSIATSSDATPAPAPAPAAPPAADPTAPKGGDRLAALRAAMRTPAVDTETPDAPVVADRSATTATSTAPADDPAHVDDEITLAPHDSAPNDLPAPLESDDGRAPIVTAIRCGRGHVNPTHVGVCQTCGDLLDADAPHESIRQPPLAVLELPDGERISVDRQVVIGRRPDADAAQGDPRAVLIVVADDPSVSRTHARVDVEDWTLTITDCGSRSGTAIVTRPGEEPRILEPWVTHELPVGARLFLGGPSSIVVRPIDPRRGDGR